MREYGKIHSSFWTSRDIRAMTEDGRTLAAYLLTSPHSNMLGCFRIPPAYVSEDLQWDMERVRKGFAELFTKGWATLSEGSNWVVIHKFLKWNQPENPNVVKAAEKLFMQIPDDCGVKSCLAWAIAEFESRFGADKLAPFKPFANPFDTSPKAYRKPEPEPEPEPEPQPEPTPLSPSPAAAPTQLPLSPVPSPSPTALVAPSPKIDSGDIEKIFAYWQQRMKSPRSALDDKRRKAIRAALEMGYSPADLCKAIRGCSLTPHNMGNSPSTNPSGQKYNGITLILRSADQIDRFIANDTVPPRADAPQSSAERREAESDANLRAFLGQPDPNDPTIIEMER
ncbi:hypothetical protein [Paraburkholderia terricola]|uniref:hypothetical protein n=1 Tax=Paraburkholderia terricola TaxID=169427 RepID=UPI003ECF9A27